MRTRPFAVQVSTGASRALHMKLEFSGHTSHHQRDSATCSRTPHRCGKSSLASSTVPLTSSKGTKCVGGSESVHRRSVSSPTINIARDCAVRESSSTQHQCERTSATATIELRNYFILLPWRAIRSPQQAYRVDIDRSMPRTQSPGPGRGLAPLRKQHPATLKASVCSSLRCIAVEMAP